MTLDSMTGNRPAATTVPTVSVVVPTFNRASFLPECIDSLLGQTVRPHEIIVVDDGSSDATPEVVARYGESIAYLRKENGGKPSAVALGLAASRCEWIWVFDDDDAALPDAIEARLAALRERPDAGFVYAPHLIGSTGPDGRILTQSRHQVPHYADEAFLLEIMRGCFFHLNACLVRRSVFLQLGGLDPALFSGEDYDFQIRLARTSRGVFCARPAFVFRQHQGVRGALQVRYEASDRGKVFRRDSAAIGRKIRGDLALGEFLVPPQPGQGPDLQRQALINRAQVMANHGCVAEMVNDLRACLAFEPTRSLSALQWRQVAATIRTGWAYEACDQDWPAFEASTRVLAREPGGRSLVRALARGLVALATGYDAPWRERAHRLHRAARVWLTSWA